MAKEKPLRITDEEVAQLAHAITIACGELIGQVEGHEHLLGLGTLAIPNRLRALEELWDADKKGVDYLSQRLTRINDDVERLLEWAEFLSHSNAYHNGDIAGLKAEIDELRIPWYVKRWRQLANLVRPPESF